MALFKIIFGLSKDTSVSLQSPRISSSTVLIVLVSFMDKHQSSSLIEGTSFDLCVSLPTCNINTLQSALSFAEFLIEVHQCHTVTEGA